MTTETTPTTPPTEKLSQRAFSPPVLTDEQVALDRVTLDLREKARARAARRESALKARDDDAQLTRIVWLVGGMLLAVLVVSLLWAGRGHAEGPSRIDTFDKNSNRTGYITIDPKTGRVDRYGVDSRRDGYGTIDPRTGTIELFTRDGRRDGSGILTPRGGAIRQDPRR